VTVADAVETAATSSLPLPSMLIWSSSFEQLCHRGPKRLCPTNWQAALLRLSALKASQHSTRSEKPPLPGSTFARFRPYHKAKRHEMVNQTVR
jgi:hypothetical protein